MGLIKKILSAIVSNNYLTTLEWSGTRGGEKLMKKVRALFVAIKVKWEVIMNAMIKRTAIRFRKFMDPAYPVFNTGLRNRTYVCPRHNQPQNDSLASVSLLQTKSHRREKHPGVALQLSHGQNTHRQLDLQCGFVPDSSFCRKYRSLVQKTVPTKRISHYNTGNHTHRFFSYPCEVGQKRETKHSQTSLRLSLPKGIFASISKNLQATFTQNFSFLQVVKNVSPTISGQTIAVFTHF